MIKSDHIQKQLNDLLNSGDDGSEDDVFLAEDIHAEQTIIPQPKVDEMIIQPEVKKEEAKEAGGGPAPLYERADEFEEKKESALAEKEVILNEASSEVVEKVDEERPMAQIKEEASGRSGQPIFDMRIWNR